MLCGGIVMSSLLYFLLWAAVIFFMMRVGCGAHVMGHGHDHSDSRSGGPSTGPDAAPNAAGRWVAPEKDVDPVCHMSVETAKAKSAVYDGHVYYFCSQDCRGKFEADPHIYLNTASAPSAAKEQHHAC
jgi:YHS domain-containing protein